MLGSPQEDFHFMSFHSSTDIGSKTLSIESGKLAQQANGSVVARYGDNVLLVTATTSKPREGIDFFPLTIDVEERLYARGKIPGSFFRREGRPSTHATLIARLTDRPIRPRFPDGFRNDAPMAFFGKVLRTDEAAPCRCRQDIEAIQSITAASQVIPKLLEVGGKAPLASFQLSTQFDGNTEFGRMDISDFVGCKKR